MITVSNLTKEFLYGDNTYKALDNVSLEVSDGDMLAIMGPSGSGKSTLLNILGMADSGSNGKYFFDNMDTSTFSDAKKAEVRNSKIGFIFQDFALLPFENAITNVEIPLCLGKTKGKDIRRKAEEALRAANLPENQWKKPVRLLSGGEQQRVAVARAIVSGANLILADEPTGALDSENAKLLMDLFKKLNDGGKTIVIVTHDVFVADQCKRIVHLCDGKIT